MPYQATVTGRAIILPSRWIWHPIWLGRYYRLDTELWCQHFKYLWKIGSKQINVSLRISNYLTVETRILIFNKCFIRSDLNWEYSADSLYIFLLLFIHFSAFLSFSVKIVLQLRNYFHATQCIFGRRINNELLQDSQARLLLLLIIYLFFFLSIFRMLKTCCNSFLCNLSIAILIWQCTTKAMLQSRAVKHTRPYSVD